MTMMKMMTISIIKVAAYVAWIDSFNCIYSILQGNLWQFNNVR